MSQVAEQTAETVADVVEEGVDGVVDVIEFTRNNPWVLAAVGALGLVAGGVGGYLIAKNQLKSYYDDLSTQEIAEAKEFYASLNKVSVDGEPLTPQQVLAEKHGPDAVAEAVRRYQGITEDEELDALDEEVLANTVKKVRVKEVEVEVEEEPEGFNTFQDTSFDYEEEIKHRTADAPYIITHDEYFENEGDLDMEALLYFELDDTLVPEENEMKAIEDTDSLIGDDHLLRFGSGSNHADKVYIRNEKVGTIYEITRSAGSYLEEVLGMSTDEPDTLKHSNRNSQQNRRREFRRGLDG